MDARRSVSFEGVDAVVRVAVKRVRDDDADL